MTMIRNSQQLIDLFIESKGVQDETLITSLSRIPELSREEFLKLGKVLSNDDIVAKLRPADKRLVWHVAMPKSGSTWVSSVLKKGLSGKGWKNVNLLPTYGHREQEVVPLEILRQSGLNDNVFAAHQHCSYSSYAFNFIKTFNVHLILQVRNIADCILSYIDHLNKGEVVIPYGHQTVDTWAGYSDEQKLSFVVNILVPWYVDFWAGWSSGLKDNNISYCLVTYDDLIANPSSEFQRVASYCDSSITGSEVNAWLELGRKSNTRKNKGVAGRGESLPLWVHERLQTLTSFYPNTDFSSIGLGPSYCRR
ncbi:sulfotransferase domain-containing protein [Aliiglaciecola sp.]|nr:sulfotransferase domain-containing protein [Aliiglaciecola sp.]